ncbi:MAG TPA: vitamin B12-dependent ribonucleotide reductase [Egibacteraceae bacterium]|nr:vitamin B12-dependent ribonucleotide reductase [Egibacteraceae bacterium]
MVTTHAQLRAVPSGHGMGLKIDRFFTNEGTHPYDEIDWELRDAVIKDWKTGAVAFEQRDVEFPKSWSMNATTIVAQKYFRGPLGSPERERSVRQMIDRVADRITGWGRKDGYFADDGSARVFNEELKSILVTQRAAFNSPVWFNVGVPGRNQQCSACYILSVDDTMSSILNWYTEEGLIFKGGSGAGVNLSRIRSSQEHLAGGGEASGPVSFMRGADASAGTIKSGGTTRRAAKMVILNVDHPDIEEFIWCKCREESKARALAAAGFDMDLDGKDAGSIQYQNANNSVRVTDEFMRAVEADADFELKAVTTGETVKTVKARALMRQIAQAAWECADPGVQYDTTINDWHTTPNAGRINGSNPCSEYMHLDNSACNLASLNLRKFETDGVFDVEAFKRAVEIVFTAQEIMVGNSSYPTENITENARRYRQLGLGYANLGGLLMSQGLAYDSDEGRAWASTITALMTGHAYRTSAELAKVQGPFEGYAADRDGMLRVIAKHKDAANAIDTRLAPANILAAAKESWGDALALGTEHGIRNAQASVLAPTGCLVGGSLVATERGLVRLSSLGEPGGDRWQDLDIDVATDDGPRQATKFYVNGLESVVTVDTARGYRIQGTPRHRIKVVGSDGQWQWKRFSEITEGDRVPLALDQLVGWPQRVPLPPLAEASGRGRAAGSPGGGDLDWTGEHHAEVPRTMTPELAEFVGYFMGDGSLHSRGVRLCVAAEDFDVIEHLSQLGKELFNLEAHVSQQTGYTEVAFHSVRLVHWWEACGFAKHSPADGHVGKGWHPHIPEAVLYSNDAAVYTSFLRGLYEADGTVTLGYPRWSTTSYAFSRDVQSLLLALGYPTTRKNDRTGWGDSELAVLRLLNLGYNEAWLADIGFISGRKNALVNCTRTQQSSRKDYIPLTRAMVEQLAPDHDRLRSNLLQGVQRGRVSRTLATELYERTGDEELGHLLTFFYDTVASAELGEDEFTYDLSVPDNVTYLANGFVSHNTIGLLMDCDTTGIEPDLGLVKMKKLVGGGTMRIVNQTVPAALAKLGYQPEQVEAIVAYIDEHATIEGAPAFRDEHLPVFDCAMGERSIAPGGHIRMMAAAQPWISGAISKCVTGETLLPTEDGLIRIASLHRGEEADSFRPEVREVASLGGGQKTDAFYFGGQRDVRRLTLRSGHAVTGTENHRVMVATEVGPFWRYLDEVQPGEYVAVQYGAERWSQMPVRFDDFAPGPAYGSQKPIAVPDEMTEELAFLLGAYAAEGHTACSTWTISITNTAPSVLERLKAAWESELGLPAKIVPGHGHRCPSVMVSSKRAVEFLDYLGCGRRASAKRIPDAILRSPRHMVLAFLQGLFLDAYASVTQMPKLAICLDAPQLLDDFQAVLTNLGVVHGRISKHDAEYDKTYDEVYAVGGHAGRLARLVPFTEPEKAARAARLPVEPSAHATADVVPGISGRELYELIPRGRPGSKAKGTGRHRWRFLRDQRTRHVTRHTLERLAAEPGVTLPAWLQSVLDDGLHFSPVESIEDAGKRDVYDISVPATHAFVGNGIVNHNTVNLPESATVADVEGIYVAGWKLGLKALAIYRDNCKVAQPLAIDKRKSEPASTTEEAAAHGMVRRRLPKQRPSQTISFQVGDAEGYLTAGEYPGDGLGEIFVKLGKQGSTLSGVMDAFAISVSLGLQYGVPLEAYVRKFTNMRFEPAGMTDDPEVKFTSSIVDYIFRRLAIEYLPTDKRHELNIYTREERNAALNAGYPSADAGNDTPTVDAEGQTVLPVERPVPVDDLYGDAPMCFTCGIKMQRAGSCHVCESCGTTSGCS